jgi:CelD/BcsL family acetyltransferase involved in cellulose biosynthesis
VSSGRAPHIEPLDSLDAARPTWEALSVAGANPFATWAWADAWWRQWGRSRGLALYGVHRTDGSLAAIVPLCRAGRGPLRALRWLGHGPGDQLGPVCAPADRSLAARALPAALQRERGVLLAERLPVEDGWPQLLNGVLLRREPNPVLPLTGDWDAYLASRSANFRQTVRRRERRLARAHTLRYRLADDPARLDADLDVLFDLHRRRFGARSSILGARTQAFHRDLAARALAGGWLRLWLLELDGRPAAAWYGFRFGGREWYYQAGWDPARARDAVGFVLLAHSVRAAMADGMSEYRFLRGGEAFKDRFGPRDEGLVTVGIARGAAGHAALAAARAALRPKARSPVGRATRRLAGRAGWTGAT